MNTFLELIHSRHSFRGEYQAVPVKREDLIKIMQAGIDAPSGCNKQTTSFIAIDDPLSTKLITEKEYEMIGLNMSQGISFFNPTFKGSKEEALKWIVDHQLSPSVLVRSAFCKEAIEDKRQRCKDVDIENIQFLSIDLSQENWINTLLQGDYQEDQLSISSMLGLSYYLTKDEFKKMLKQLSKYLLKGSRLVFDYPSIQESKETKINEMLAKEADESMKAKYSFAELKEILNQCHLTIIQHENHQTVTEKYISNYNAYYKDDPIKAPEGVCYCVVEK